MAELADAPDLKSGGLITDRAGSNPAISTKFEIPLGCDLVVSKERYEAWTEALIKATVEKLAPVEVGALGGIKIYVQPHIPLDMIFMVAPDPDFHGRTKIVKIIKLVS